jgi:uncharacterized phage-associated protein
MQLRKLLPDASAQNLNNLLYLCQGYMVHRVNTPLFENELLAVDEGVQLGPLFSSEFPVQPSLSPVEMTVVSEVVNRYGHRADEDVAGLVRETHPWIEAHNGGWYIAPK